jgi:hypothetical protein
VPIRSVNSICGHQRLYAAARPSTLGLLLQVASRIRTTQLDVTSMVRHQSYQRRLRRTNPNASISLAMHTFGLAFDVSILHAPLASTREIRDVLRLMRDAGDLFFVAEVRQLVFHVVVAPGRAPFHAAIFESLVKIPPAPWIPTPLPLGFATTGWSPPCAQCSADSRARGYRRSSRRRSRSVCVWRGPGQRGPLCTGAAWQGARRRAASAWRSSHRQVVKDTVRPA